jgi:hypothetical protein
MAAAIAEIPRLMKSSKVDVGSSIGAFYSCLKQSLPNEIQKLKKINNRRGKSTDGEINHAFIAPPGDLDE